MKTGANQQDRLYIRRRAADGAAAEVISREAGIELRVVQNFMPAPEAEIAPKRARKKAAAAEPDPGAVTFDDPE